MQPLQANPPHLMIRAAYVTLGLVTLALCVPLVYWGAMATVALVDWSWWLIPVALVAGAVTLLPVAAASAWSWGAIAGRRRAGRIGLVLSLAAICVMGGLYLVAYLA